MSGRSIEFSINAKVTLPQMDSVGSQSKPPMAVLLALIRRQETRSAAGLQCGELTDDSSAEDQHAGDEDRTNNDSDPTPHDVRQVFL